MKSKIDAHIAELYRLPLDEFTSARNTLAKTLSGDEKKAIASLVKPSLAMWFVNQLYWQDAPAYRALVDASEKLRTAHLGALSGRKIDTRKADELHKATLEKAFARTAAIAQKHGTTFTDTVRDAVRRTLAALPTDEPAGRLTREPPPAGFSLLTGVSPRAVAPATAKPRAAEEPKKPTRAELQRQKLEEKIRREAEIKARKEEEKARKEKEKREREIRKAEEALRDAERRLAALKG